MIHYRAWALSESHSLRLLSLHCHHFSRQRNTRKTCKIYEVNFQARGIISKCAATVKSTVNRSESREYEKLIRCRSNYFCIYNFLYLRNFQQKFIYDSWESM